MPVIETKYGYGEIPDFKRDPNIMDFYLDAQRAAEKLGVSKFQFLQKAEKLDLYPDFMATSRSGKESPRWSNQKIDWWVDNVLSKQYSPIKFAKTVKEEVKANKRYFLHRKTKEPTEN